MYGLQTTTTYYQHLKLDFKSLPRDTIRFCIHTRGSFLGRTLLRERLCAGPRINNSAIECCMLKTCASAILSAKLHKDTKCLRNDAGGCRNPNYAKRHASSKRLANPKISAAQRSQCKYMHCGKVCLAAKTLAGANYKPNHQDTRWHEDDNDARGCNNVHQRNVVEILRASTHFAGTGAAYRQPCKVHAGAGDTHWHGCKSAFNIYIPNKHLFTTVVDT